MSDGIQTRPRKSYKQGFMKTTTVEALSDKGDGEIASENSSQRNDWNVDVDCKLSFQIYEQIFLTMFKTKLEITYNLVL